MRLSSTLRFLGISFTVVAIVVLGSAQAPNFQTKYSPLAKPGVVQFEDIALQVGLTALNVYGGDKHKEFIIETTGNGVAIFDYDNDGWPDIFLPNGSTVEGVAPGSAPTGHLYHNNHDGTFTDVTTTTEISISWRPSGDRTCYFTTTAMARSPMSPKKPA
jgi:hypothetical protein